MNESVNNEDGIGHNKILNRKQKPNENYPKFYE
jgi:hypothetical protein